MQMSGVIKLTFSKPSVCVVDYFHFEVGGNVLSIVVKIYKARECIQQISVTTMSGTVLG